MQPRRMRRPEAGAVCTAVSTIHLQKIKKADNRVRTDPPQKKSGEVFFFLNILLTVHLNIFIS